MKLMLRCDIFFDLDDVEVSSEDKAAPAEVRLLVIVPVVALPLIIECVRAV